MYFAYASKLVQSTRPDPIRFSDIRFYAYTHVLQGSGFELEQYSYIRDWLNTIETTLGYIPMAGVNA